MSANSWHKRWTEFCLARKVECHRTTLLLTAIAQVEIVDTTHPSHRYSLDGSSVSALNVCRHRPRHQGGAHGGRAPAKIVRAPAKITGLIMFHLGCQIKNWVFLVFFGIFGIKNEKRPNGNPVFHGGAVGVDGWVTLTLIPLVTRLKCIV